jgi:excisionase family DNA binding protein
MLPNLSPKDLACTIGVSESSLKRWVDEGRLGAQRTNGGHRRIAIHEAIRFLRASAVDLSQPQMLGIPELTAERVLTVSKGHGEAALLDALRRGDSTLARGLIIAEFLLSRSFGAVADGPIAFAMNSLINELRAGGDGHAAILRTSEIVAGAVSAVAGLMEPPSPDAPRAIGCQLGQVRDDVSAALAAAALRECGYADSIVSHDALPIRPSASTPDPRGDLLWLGIASAADRPQVEPVLTDLITRIGSVGRIVLCGRGAVGQDYPARFRGVVVAGSMCELQSIARAARAERTLAARRDDSKSREKIARLN